MKQIILLVALAMSLAACKADLVEVRINSADIAQVVAGGSSTARFIAKFSTFGDLDDAQRQEIDTIEDLIEERIAIDDFQITKGDYNTSITVEGEIPMRLGAVGGSKDAFAVYVTTTSDPLLPNFAYTVQLAPGLMFDRLESAMQGVSYMLAIDAVQPVQYRIRADNDNAMKILAGGVQVDGRNYAVRTFELADGERLSLTFAGGAYDSTPGAFLITDP